MNDKLEELKLYQFYVDLLFYIYQITEKYPKHEKLGLVSDIKNISFSGLECLIDAQKDFNPKNRLIYLNKLNPKLKSLKVLVRISYKFKYINGKNYYVIKADIKKYFYSINKEILYQILKRNIKDNKLLRLTKILIYDNNDDTSIPIGNYTSQYFANIYLNELDQYIKNILRIKYYLRYMDDFCILLKSKDECKRVLYEIKNFLSTNLKLELNPKTRYYPSKFGVNFCGYVIHEDYMLLRKSCIKKIKKRIKTGTFDLKKYKGHLIHANAYNFISTINKTINTNNII